MTEWTIGLLTNHVWSFAGDENSSDINSTFLQPFISYITKTKTTFTLNSESTYDWESRSWSAPINILVSQLLKVNNQCIRLEWVLVTG